MTSQRSVKPSRTLQRLHVSRESDAIPSDSSPPALKQPSICAEAVRAAVNPSEMEDSNMLNGIDPDADASHSLHHLVPVAGLSSKIPSVAPGRTDARSDLVALPPELLLELTKFLSFASLLSLRSTCSSMRHLLSPSHVRTHRENIINACLAAEKEQHTEYRNKHPRPNYSHLWDLFYYAFEWQLQERPSKELVCYGCLESKPLHCFVERLASRGTGLNGDLARHRRCKVCMRRFYHIQGQWWREHWLRKFDHKKCRGKTERLRRWIMKGESLVETVDRSDQVGVCAQCHGTQFELWWGCVGCFEKEERRYRRIDGETWGVARGESDDDKGLQSWLLQKSEDLRRRRATRKRKRHTKRLERGRWWRRLWRHTLGGGMLRWEGTWEARVEALVEVALGNDKDDDLSDDADSENSRAKPPLPPPDLDTPPAWSPWTSVPLPHDRREARCSMCWVPTCRKTKFMLGMAEQGLPCHRWCGPCQREDRERKERSRWRRWVLWGDEGTRPTIWDDREDVDRDSRAGAGADAGADADRERNGNGDKEGDEMALAMERLFRID